MRVVDPSRPNTHAFIGIGFQERDEAFEFENALRTHDKYAQRQAEIERQQREWAANHQDLSLKSGQTIQVSIKSDPHKPQHRKEPRTSGGLQFSFAAPGAGSGFFAPPPTTTTSSSSFLVASLSSPAPSSSAQPDWFSSLPMASPAASVQTAPASFDFASFATSTSQTPQAANSDDWTDFSSSSSTSKNTANDSWANF